MGRPRKPAKVLELSGAWKQNPSRERCNPVNENPLGNPPTYFAPDEKKVWRELIAHSVPGVLTAFDRIIVETLCISIAKLRRREVMKVAEISLILTGLGRLGMTPADRARLEVAPPPKDDGDEYSEFD